jgi:hypothetical protein
MKIKCSKCRNTVETNQEGAFTCPSCGFVTEPRREVPSVAPKPLKVEVLPPSPSQWGCTDLLEPVPVKTKPVELPPDPLPEYITPKQARKWGIKIRFLGDTKHV